MYSRWIAGLTGVLLACALPGVATGDAQDAREGIENAREAGIKVDGAAAELMANAPLGSCLNDPTQARCDAPTKIVAAPTYEASDGSTVYSLVDPSAKPTAQVAQIDQCRVRTSYPYYAAGHIRSDGAQDCSAAVTRQELDESLYQKRDDGTWRLVDSDYTTGPGGRTIRAYAAFNCSHANSKAYKATASGYALLRTVWYAAQQTRYDTRRCGSD